MRELAAAIVLAGVVVAVGIAPTERFKIVPLTGGLNSLAYRLNTWTGAVELCVLKDGKVSCSPSEPVR